MGTQGTGRKRSTKKERSTAEDDALNLIAREAEARLAAKRAARAEAREIRMKELERQQKEIFQVQKEDSERYSRSTRIQTLSDDDERMSVGSRGSVRSDLDAVGAYGGGGSSSSLSLKKSKKKKKHKHKDKDRNGYDDDYSVISSRSSRISDESRASRSSRLDLTSSRLSDDSRLSRASRSDLQPASYASSDLYNLNGLSSSRNTGSAFNGYQFYGSLSQITKQIYRRSSLYEDSLHSASRRVVSSTSQPLDYTSYRSSGSRVSSRASSARASPVDNCGSVASFLRSAASSSGLPRDLDDVTIPDFSDVEDRDYLEKGSRAASALTAGTLTSLGGSSSRRGSGETAITVDAETSIREIKEIHELKDQIQDVELKYTQNLKEAKDALAEVEEKYRKAMVSNAQLDNEKNNLMYQVDTLKDSLMELEELLSESQRGYEEKVKEFEREKHAHSVLQFQFNEMKETLKQSEELLNEIRQLRLKQDGFIREISDLQETVEWKDKKIAALERQKEYTDAIRIERDELREEVVTLKDILKKHGIVLGPDLNINGDIGVAEVDGSPSADAASQPAPDSQTTPTEGNSMLGNTEETQLRSSGEEEVDPEQHQEMFEEAKENLLSSDTICDVDGVPALETPDEQEPTEEQQENTQEDSVDESGLSKDLNVDIKDSSVQEATDLIVCSAGLQAITSSEENAPETETPEGGDLEETETRSSSVDTHSDDMKESHNILEEQENKKEVVEESHLRNAESCHQQKVMQDVKTEPVESIPAVSNTEPEPENAEEAENDEAEEISSKSQPQGAAASGKKKRKKRRGKKKGGANEDKNQQKDETEVKTEKVKTEKDTEAATRDNGQTTEPAKPDVDGSVNETLEESKVNQVKNEQDRQEIQEVDGVEAVKPTETFSHSETLKESTSDHVTDEHDTEQTSGSVEVEPVTTTESFSHIEIRVDHVTDEPDEEISLETEAVEAVAPSETFSCIETLEESKTDLKTDVQDDEQTSEAETVEPLEAVKTKEVFSDLDTLKESRTDPQKDEHAEEQNLKTAEVEVESKTSLVSEANPCSHDLIGTSSGAENSPMDADTSTDGDVVHTDSEIVDSAENEVGSTDEMKSECTVGGEGNTDAESHVPSNDDVANDESDSANNSESKDNSSVSLPSIDGITGGLKRLSGWISAAMNLDNSSTSNEVSDKDPEEATETTKDDEEAEAETEQESVPLSHDELDRDLMDSEGLAEPNSSSRKEKSRESESLMENTDGECALEQDHCAEESAAAEDSEHQNSQNDKSETLLELHEPRKDKSEDNGSSLPILQDSDEEKPNSSSCKEKRSNSESPTENTDAFETEKSPETVAQAEQLDDAESQTLQRDDQSEEPKTEVSSETEEIKDHCAEESAVADSPERQNSQSDQSETLLELHEPSKESEDNGSSQPILQDSDEEDGEDEEGQSFDFDDMDIEMAIATDPPKSPKQGDIEEGVEVMSESSGLCQSKTGSNENTQDEPVANDDKKCTVDGGNQDDTLDKETDAVPDEEATSEKGENVRGEQKSTPEEEVVVADEPVIEVGKVVELGDGAENTDQATSFPVEEGLDAITQELQSEDLALPKSADKEQSQTRKESKKNGKKGKGKGKEECKMS
ncbi:protein slender lobes isoform X4 [Acanthopagrus latus]|uniref:protein slender lobes isoform X4 n=1 Tax=Acanthopagrus latus TaxID=8177 RepID=UPI00187C4E88|nr:protein slender lobes isoform X4 [Acanthopagrus latus]